VNKRIVSSRVLVALMVVALSALPLIAQDTPTPEAPPAPTLLTEPFLQMPTETTVNVVWFTEFAGSGHGVTYGESLDQTAAAETMKMSRLAEDQRSRVGEQTEDGQVYSGYTPRDVWRHEAVVPGLTQGARTPYFVTSIADDGTEVTSREYTLAPLPQPGEALQILLTSDNQLMPMTPTNLQKVVEFFGEGTIDAVFLAGDLQNIPDRASEWFDDNRGRAFFPALQGTTSTALERTFVGENYTAVSTTNYTGGAIIQYAPLFPATGNHEVMGRFNPGNDIGFQYNDPRPRAVAEARYEELASLVNPNNDPAVREQWIIDNSWNTITYEEIFTLPSDGPGGETYYAMQYGDVYVISLFSTRIWRTPGLGNDARGKYREALRDLNNPDNWGYGDFIFEDLAQGSEQYNWLVEQLNSEAFQNARYKVVLLHQGPHGLGDNYNPVMAHPVQIIDRDAAGNITGVRYEYPIEDDIVLRDVMPLLEEAGVQLMHQGHSHLWFRMETEGGIDIIETSNVGNNYGCYLEGYRERGNTPLADARYNPDNYALFGDPHGLLPIMPSIFSPQTSESGEPLPCVNSNDLTVFSVLDTGTGIISSYVFDTRQPDSEIRLFDEFSILNDEG
jgi:hypothetical protein